MVENPNYLKLSKWMKIMLMDGYSNESARKFLSKYQSFWTLQNLTDDRQIIAAFHLHLKGPPLVWFLTSHHAYKELRTVLLEAFENQYIPGHLCDPIIIAESAMVDVLTPHPTIPIETFHSQVVEKCSRLDKPERDLTSKIIKSLPQQPVFPEQVTPDACRMLSNMLNS